MTDHFDLFVRYSTALYWQHTHNIMYGVDMSTLDELNINMPLSLVNHGLKFHFGARTRSYRSVGVVAIKSNQIKSNQMDMHHVDMLANPTEHATHEIRDQAINAVRQAA